MKSDNEHLDVEKDVAILGDASEICSGDRMDDTLAADEQTREPYTTDNETEKPAKTTTAHSKKSKFSKKDKIKIIRTIFEFVVLGFIALILVRLFTVQISYEPYAADDVSGEDKGFIALSYFGVDQQETDTLISTERLSEHLDALNALGYVTITQEDIENYYYNGTPLPEKALFLMFEDGRRDTALFSEKILEKNNFKASILTYAEKFELNDPKFISPSDLRSLNEYGFWELGTNGYRLAYINCYDRYERYLGQLTSDEYVSVVSYLGRDYNHYLMDYLRDEDRVPTETYSEMKSRISQDYTYMSDIYMDEFGYIPELYCIMHSNTDRFGNVDAVSDVNAENLEDLFLMNFNREGYAWNTADSSVYDLTRLQPQSYWYTNHLLMRIKDDLPEEQKDNISFISGDSDEKVFANWLLKNGAVEYRKQDESIVVTSEPSGDGEVVFTRGYTADSDGLHIEVELNGNVIGEQSITIGESYGQDGAVKINLNNNVLYVSQRSSDVDETLFEMDLWELTDLKDRVSIEEDSRDALVAEYNMRGRFCDSASDSLIFYRAARLASLTAARSIEEGAEEYIPEFQINDSGNRKLLIDITGDAVSISVDNTEICTNMELDSFKPNTVWLGAHYGEQGYSQRNLTDDVYDAVFTRLYIRDQAGNVLVDTRLHGFEKLWKEISVLWKAIVNWFIENL